MTSRFRSLLPLSGIRTRMLLLVLAIGGLFVLYIGVNTHRQAERDHQDAREQLRLVAEIAASRLDDHVGAIGQLLNTLAATLPVDLADPQRNDAVLRSLAPQLPANVHGISLWAEDGSSIGSTEFWPDGVRPSAADREFFIAARRHPGTASEAPIRLDKGGAWTAVFATRIVRDGRPAAVVSVSSRLETLTKLLDPDETLQQGAVITLSNADARVVARSQAAERWIGQPMPIDRVQVLRRLADGKGNAEATGLDGKLRVFGFARARSLPWLVNVGLPVDDALAAVRENRRDGLVLGAAVLLVGLVFAAWFAHRITQPLRELSADAKRLGEGDLAHRSRVHSGGEVGLLAKTLNRMAAALQERIFLAKRQEERLTLALEGSEQALFDWDLVADRIHYSSRASLLRGGPNVESDVTPQAMRDFVHPDDLPAVEVAMRLAIRGDVPIYEVEFRVCHRDGRWIWLRSRGRVVERDAKTGRALRMVGTDSDVTRKKAIEDELRLRAERDVLTGLPNRALFFDRIDGAIARARREHKTLALLYLDIDRFKSINDNHGHAAGDTVLKTTAQRLLAAVRSTDTVSRLSGDEFTVILEALVERSDAAAVAEKLVEAMREPIEIGDRCVSISSSVGIAILEAGDAGPTELLRRADDALYDAKRNGRDRYAVSRAPTHLSS